MIKQVSRWLVDRSIILVGDGSFACIRPAHTCIQLGKVTLISRLRLDARLFDFPGPEVPGKRGPKPQKGDRLPKLKNLVDDPDQNWQEAHVKQLTPIQIVEYFVLRWSVEVTFQESRRHLGVETQRQFSCPELGSYTGFTCYGSLKCQSRV